jgi:membrane protease YdiL (CAAX protease family)
MSRAAGVRAVDEVSALDRSPLPLGYFQKSKAPLACLLFLVPLLIAYEVGTHFYASDWRHHTEQRIKAFELMQKFFLWFGATGKYLPAMAVVAVLLSCHVTHKHRWELDFATAGCMALESILLSLPLFLLDSLSNRWVPMMNGAGNLRSMLVLSIGAGVYEEAVFRLGLLTLLSIIFVDMFRFRRKSAILLMVVISAVSFAAYHYLGSETFSWRTFAFRTAAGVYFSALFYWRGFGLTAGCHAAYDIVAVCF